MSDPLREAADAFDAALAALKPFAFVARHVERDKLLELLSGERLVAYLPSELGMSCITMAHVDAAADAHRALAAIVEAPRC